MLELLKVIVQPVVLERDQDGRIVGEKLGQATPCYSLEEVIVFMHGLDQQIKTENRLGEEVALDGEVQRQGQGDDRAE